MECSRTPGHCQLALRGTSAFVQYRIPLLLYPPSWPAVRHFYNILHCSSGAPPGWVWHGAAWAAPPAGSRYPASRDTILPAPHCAQCGLERRGAQLPWQGSGGSEVRRLPLGMCLTVSAAGIRGAVLMGTRVVISMVEFGYISRDRGRADHHQRQSRSPADCRAQGPAARKPPPCHAEPTTLPAVRMGPPNP